MEGGGRIIPAGLIDRLVEERFPTAYFNPARWGGPNGTADGYMPFPIFPLFAAAIFPALALERLNVAQSIAMTMAEKAAAQGAWDAAVREAYPAEG